MMTKYIQRIIVDADTLESLYIISVDFDNMIIEYRHSIEPENKIKSKYKIDNPYVCLDDCYFHVNYLNKFKTN